MRRLALVLLPLLLTGVFTPPAEATSRSQQKSGPPSPPTIPYNGVSVFRITPAEAKPGDRIWLSGTGFQPNRRLEIHTWCPNWSSPTAIPDHNYDRIPIQRGPVTDNHGAF